MPNKTRHVMYRYAFDQKLQLMHFIKHTHELFMANHTTY